MKNRMEFNVKELNVNETHANYMHELPYMVFNYVSHEINMKLKCRNFQTHKVGILYLNILFVKEI